MCLIDSSLRSVKMFGNYLLLTSEALNVINIALIEYSI